jgi:hypothetical protein
MVLLLGWPLSAAAGGGVQVGEPAPEFALTDADGDTRTLSEFAGRFVVLEWFNHDCPFVRKHYASGNMQRLQRSATTQGVAWLSVNSSAPGKQGHLTPEEARRLTREKDAAPTAVLLDPDGTVGRRYGAKTTPHLFIVNPEGVIIYQGAMDDRPSIDPDDIVEATNYVEAALNDALAGSSVLVSLTKSYGCTVK